MTDSINPEQPVSPSPSRLRTNRNTVMAGIAVAVLAIGAAAGAGGTRLAQNWQPQRVMLLQPGPIEKLQDDAPAAVKGNVAEIFGNKFILQDGSGRALVDLGPRGDFASVVTKGEDVTVQGRFDRGIIHAQVLVHSDGRTEAFGPKPPRPDRGPPDRRGPRAEFGPDRGPPSPGADRGPPPPPDAPPPR